MLLTLISTYLLASFMVAILLMAFDEDSEQEVQLWRVMVFAILWPIVFYGVLAWSIYQHFYLKWQLRKLEKARITAEVIDSLDPS